MKRLLISLVATIGLTATLSAQTGCSKFYSLKEGSKAEITSYNSNDKKIGSMVYTVTDVAKTADGKVATMQAAISNNKGKLMAEMEYKLTCGNDKISIDYNSMMSPMMTEQFKNVEYDITGTDIEIPNNLSVGQSLPEANLNVNLRMAQIKMTMESTITNRKVTGREKVTTPAGTFDCFVITSDLTTTMATTQTSNMKQWIAEGVGMVKQEEYRNGSLKTKSLLTSFSN